MLFYWNEVSSRNFRNFFQSSSKWKGKRLEKLFCAKKQRNYGTMLVGTIKIFVLSTALLR